jgi:hypothetical protein
MTGRVSAIDIQGGMMLKLKKPALLSVLPLVFCAAHHAQAPDENIRHKILVSNPVQLYGFGNT